MAKFVDNYSDLKELGIDCEECDDSLTEAFGRAADHLKILLPNVDNQTLLTLYGYYKQGSEGVCSIPKPSWYDMRAKSKWEAWRKLGDMSQVEAKKLYIETIKKLDSSFDDTVSPSTPKEQWVKVSSMPDERNIAESDKTLVDYIKEGNVTEVKGCLKSPDVSALVNETDEEGLAPIHWAADSGFVKVLEVLIGAGADVNLKDSDGQTALHYASSCGQAECVKCLLRHGAQVDVTDNEGCTAASVASDESIKELLNTF
ncbi:acyl-CoA-binding domain-containing protein 6-like [Anoplophora glabripennis]|uniref:acyl-CoA-binding domain-containing protein 6-like n=1 Tax=Anoplophora glabripennis TaxID=217634 RepID=UPI0008747F75|nr:acyl-CoA-binding domain-containing protein 6-like [Anoplophora glabripennis]